MQFLSTIAILMAAVPAFADFHITHTTTRGLGATQYELVASPSNYYNCKAFFAHDRSVLGSESDLDSNTFFYAKSGLCGLGQLNFYKQDDSSWLFYQDGGNGDLQGTCYGNSDYTNCGSSGYGQDRLICYSYICN